MLSCEQIARQSLNINMGNKSFESLELFKCMVTTLSNPNCIQEEYKAV